MIRKEAFVNESVMAELKRIIEDSEVMKCAPALSPPPAARRPPLSSHLQPG